MEKCSPRRPVPVIHFHGTDDKLVPFNGPDQRTAKVFAFKSVEETIRTWVKIDGCPTKPKTTKLPHKGDDGTTVERKTYGPGKEGAEVDFVRHQWRRSHLAWKEVARALARQDDSRHLGQRPDVGVLQATSDDRCSRTSSSSIRKYLPREI